MPNLIINFPLSPLPLRDRAHVVCESIATDIGLGLGGSNQGLRGPLRHQKRRYSASSEQQITRARGLQYTDHRNSNLTKPHRTAESSGPILHIGSALLLHLQVDDHVASFIPIYPPWLKNLTTDSITMHLRCLWPNIGLRRSIMPFSPRSGGKHHPSSRTLP